MNSKKVYICLYYLAFILSIWVCAIPRILQNNLNIYVDLSRLSYLMVFANIVLVITFTILLIKKKLGKVNILFPIIYILFTIIVLVICFLFNSRLVIANIQFSYYIKFILINYVLFNTYSILSINSLGGKNE